MRLTGDSFFLYVFVSLYGGIFPKVFDDLGCVTFNLIIIMNQNIKLESKGLQFKL